MRKQAVTHPRIPAMLRERFDGESRRKVLNAIATAVVWNHADQAITLGYA
jgi:hypothetical protein